MEFDPHPNECECGNFKDERSKQCRECYTSRHANITEKQCNGCKQTFPIEQFNWRPDGRGGQKRRSRCKACEAAYTKAARKANPKVYYERKMAWVKKNPEAEAIIRLRKRAKYLGFDPDAMVLYFEWHNGLCDLCGNPPTPGFDSLSIDHCHTTGKFRGLLCANCNLGLGKFKDDIEILLKAIEYLKRSQSTD